MACNAGRCTAGCSVCCAPAAALVQRQRGGHSELGWLLLMAGGALPADLSCCWVLCRWLAAPAGDTIATCLPSLRVQAI